MFERNRRYVTDINLLSRALRELTDAGARVVTVRRYPAGEAIERGKEARMPGYLIIYEESPRIRQVAGGATTSRVREERVHDAP